MTPDAHPLLPWLTPERRAWLYRLAAALLPLLVLYGVAAEADVATWLGLVAAFLSTGTAALHTPTRIVQEPPVDLPHDPEHTTPDAGVTALEAAAISFLVVLVVLLLL